MSTTNGQATTLTPRKARQQNGNRVLHVTDAAAFKAAYQGAGWSQARLAQALQDTGVTVLMVHPSTIGHLGTGYRRSVSEVVARKLAELIGVDVWSLFDRPEPFAD